MCLFTSKRYSSFHLIKLNATFQQCLLLSSMSIRGKIPDRANLLDNKTCSGWEFLLLLEATLRGRLS